MLLTRRGCGIHVVGARYRRCRSGGGSVPQDRSAGRARAGLVIPGVGRVQALRLGRQFRDRSRRLRERSRRLRRGGCRLRVGSRRLRRRPSAFRSCPPALRRCPLALRSCPSAFGSCLFAFGSCPSALRRRGSRLRRRLFGFRRTRRGLRLGGRRPRRRAARPAGLGHGAPGVVPQGGLDDLQAPLGASPPGELRPRQHLLHLRGVVLGELQPDGDRFRLGPPGTCHGFKVPRTSVLTEARRDCLK
jgi:hypothetical protein